MMIALQKIKNGLGLPLQMKKYFQIPLNTDKISVTIAICQLSQMISNVVSLIGIILVEIAIFLVIMTKIITLKLATMLDVTSLVDYGLVNRETLQPQGSAWMGKITRPELTIWVIYQETLNLTTRVIYQKIDLIDMDFIQVDYIHLDFI